MSDIVKSLRQKHNSTFTDKIDFSPEGKSIRMLSDLNLEEEFRLGNLNGVSITEQNGIIVIIESDQILESLTGYLSITAIKEIDTKTIVLKVLSNLSETNSERAKVTIIEQKDFVNIDEYYLDAEDAISILTSWGVNL